MKTEEMANDEGKKWTFISGPGKCKSLGGFKVWGEKKKKGCVECSVKKTVRNPTAIFYFGEPLWG